MQRSIEQCGRLASRPGIALLPMQISCNTIMLMERTVIPSDVCAFLVDIFAFRESSFHCVKLVRPYLNARLPCVRPQ